MLHVLWYETGRCLKTAWDYTAVLAMPGKEHTEAPPKGGVFCFS